MCGICSRRSLITGAIATFIFGTKISSAADGDRRILCGFNDGEFKTYRHSMTSTSGDPRFDNAVIAELKRILQVIPIDPGFKYVKANNAAATPESIVGGTKGTVLIGLDFVSDLVKQDDGGVVVAGVLAHECGHIFQYFSRYHDLLKGQTHRLLELHADLLAGYYMAKKLGSAGRKLSGLQRTLIQTGTYNNLDVTNHGTPGQRNAALDKGYMLSLSGITFEDAAREGEEYVQKL
jgi:hypothetical protein